MSVIRQFSLFSAGSVAPEPDDLAGLLAGGGQITRPEATDNAQVSIVVDHPWRAAALVAECARRGLAATSVSTVDEHICVRTAHSPLLVPLAEAWAGGRAPRGLMLDGRSLRLWVLAVGRQETPLAYVLPLGRADEAARAIVGGALAAIGLGAQLVSPRGFGLSYRIVGKRRVQRLAELAGDPPKQAPPAIWPS
jgi:hypothetical protein